MLTLLCVLATQTEGVKAYSDNTLLNKFAFALYKFAYPFRIGNPFGVTNALVALARTC
jgi:hypothetical protein